MLNKAIEHGKERRKPYRGAKAVDSTCCNHGGCPYCERNRTYKNEKRLQAALEQERAARLGGSYNILTARIVYPALHEQGKLLNKQVSPKIRTDISRNQFYSR